jgi:protein ImuB
MRVLCIYFLEEAPVETIAEACFRFSPQIALGRRAIFIEIGACKHLYSEQSVLLRTQSVVSRFKKKGRLTIDDDIPTVLARAMFRSKDRRSLPVDALHIFASPFQETTMLDHAITSFKRLGIETIGEILKIPRGAITVRFGKEALLAFHHIESAYQVIWPRFIPVEKVIESENVDEMYDVTDLEPLLFLLKSILDRVMLRLRGRSQVISNFKITFHLEKYSTLEKTEREWVFDLAFPQGSVISLLPMIRDKLNFDLERNPLLAPVRKIEVQVLNSVFSKSKQTDFFSKKEEDLESFRSIVNRLSERLGFNRAFLAQPKEAYFPERNWQKTLEATSEVENKVPERPLRILRTPLELRLIDQYLFYKKRKWKVLSLEGPERISGDWWIQDKERDYFKAKLESGEEFWIFHFPESGVYFLHGIFD